MNRIKETKITVNSYIRLVSPRRYLKIVLRNVFILHGRLYKMTNNDYEYFYNSAGIIFFFVTHVYSRSINSAHLCIVYLCVQQYASYMSKKNIIYSKQMKSNDVRLAENIGVNK